EARLAVGPEWTARELGGIIGHQLAFCHALTHLPELRDRQIFKRIDNRVRRQVQGKLKEFTKCRELAVERSLVLASRQSYENAAEFFNAFSRALSRRAVDADASNFHRPNTRIYWLMLQGWKSVTRLRSVRELQQGL